MSNSTSDSMNLDAGKPKLAHLEYRAEDELARLFESLLLVPHVCPIQVMSVDFLFCLWLRVSIPGYRKFVEPDKDLLDLVKIRDNCFRPIYFLPFMPTLLLWLKRSLESISILHNFISGYIYMIRISPKLDNLIWTRNHTWQSFK